VLAWKLYVPQELKEILLTENHDGRSRRKLKDNCPTSCTILLVMTARGRKGIVLKCEECLKFKPNQRQGSR